MVLPWLAYCAFHGGHYQKSLNIYDELARQPEADLKYYVYKACCQFFLGMYKEAEESALKGNADALQNRLLFHLAHKFNDEVKLMSYHGKLQDTVEDQLSLASIHNLRSHYQEATDIYKRMLLENRNFTALNVYIALCYYRLDYFDVSLEVLAVYLQQHPDSIIGVNLKACNHYRLYNGKAAEAELKALDKLDIEHENDLIRHNRVVFANGANALKILPGLVDVVPEARLNLVIHYLRNNEFDEALKLMEDVDPTTPQEYILKGVVNACVGQENESQQHLKAAQQYFNLVGASASECDTIPGRQCMASCFFLARQFEDVLVYLKSVASYFSSDDTFNCNYGMTQAARGEYAEAEEHLLMVSNERMKSDYSYVSWLARCYIMNGKAGEAWNLYLAMENTNESFNLLQLIANDCYRMGSFIWAAMAFDVLERMDPSREYLDGKIGACVGVFQLVVAGREARENLRRAVGMLRNTSNPQVEYTYRVIKRYASENGIRVN